VVGFALTFGAIGLFFGMVIGLIQDKASQDSVIKTPTYKHDHDNRIESIHVISEATSSKTDGENTRERIMQTKRYWGIALLGILSAGVVLVLNVDSPARGAWALAMSLLIVYHSLVGNLNAVVTTAKWGLVVLVMLVLYFAFQTDGVSVLPQYVKTRFFLSYGGSALALLIILGLASSQRQDAAQEGEEPRSAPKASLIVQEEPALETEIPIERTGQLDREPTRAATSVSQIEAGQILLEYDDQVKLVYAGLTGLPQEIKDQFLIKVAQNPQANTTELRNGVLLNALGRPELKWDQELEDLIKDCKGANPDDVQELFRVFPVLSQRMSFAKVFRKVVGGDNEEFEVIKAGGKATTVIRRGNGKFLVASSFGQWTFSSDEEVYDFLGTPQNKRNSLPSS
jgi:hypothetical protein